MLGERGGRGGRCERLVFEMWSGMDYVTSRGL